MARKKRGNHEGSVFKRSDGQWCATIVVGYSSTGKRQRKTVYAATKTAVLERLDELKNQRRSGCLQDVSTTTVAEWLNHWLEIGSTTKSRKTIDRYRCVVNKHLAPRIGGLRLTKLAKPHIRELMAGLAKDGISTATQRQAYVTIKAALNAAIVDDVISKNPMAGITKPRAEKRDYVWLDAEQAKRLLEHSAETDWHAMIVLAVTTGMRLGELFGLRWKSIDLNAARLEVTHTVEDVGGVCRLKEPKTETSRRSIPLTEMAVDALVDHRKKQVAKGKAGSELVFPNKRGGLMKRGNFQHFVWKNLRKAAELPETLRFHDLRHSFASMLLSSGENVKVISELLGHHSVEITLKIYSHCIPSMKPAAVSVFDRVLAPETEPTGYKVATNRPETRIAAGITKPETISLNRLTATLVEHRA